jgi:excisionase family DNA binding protein
LTSFAVGNSIWPTFLSQPWRCSAGGCNGADGRNREHDDTGRIHKTKQEWIMNETSPNKQLLIISREAAKALAISERTLWQLTKDGVIPCVRIGRSVRYSPADLQAWIDRQKAPALSVAPNSA